MARCRLQTRRALAMTIALTAAAWRAKLLALVMTKCCGLVAKSTTPLDFTAHLLLAVGIAVRGAGRVG
ncbi:hypothetical protein CMK11_01145 [Candidatus Poribacteria bacterium]|nr:hypothetical protein [Candidatus Poribacteria bacterium]